MTFQERRAKSGVARYEKRKIEATGRRHGEPGKDWDQEILMLDHLIDQEGLRLEDASRPDEIVDGLSERVMDSMYLPSVVALKERMNAEMVNSPSEAGGYPKKIVKRNASAVIGLAIATKLEKSSSELFYKIGAEHVSTKVDEKLEEVGAVEDKVELDRLADNMRYWWMSALTEYLDATGDRNSPRYKNSNRTYTGIEDVVDRFEFAITEQPNFDLQRAGFLDIRNYLTTMLAATEVSYEAAGIDDLFSENLRQHIQHYTEALQLLARAEARMGLQLEEDQTMT